MSGKKGNTKKKPQKYQNSSAFRNDMHDTSRKTKALNQMTVGGVCPRCKEQIEWKIKYKKYKPLTQPKKCVKCEERNVTQAYHIMCKQCSTAAKACAKCGKNEEIVAEHGLSPAEEASQASQLDSELRHLSERERRTFFRYQAKGCPDDEGEGNVKVLKSREGKELREDDDSDDEDAAGGDGCESGSELDDRT